MSLLKEECRIEMYKMSLYPAGVSLPNHMCPKDYGE